MSAAALDRFLPEWEFDEHHEIGIRATPDRVDRALREVTLGDLPVSRTLAWLRVLPVRVVLRRRVSLEMDRPLLDVFRRVVVPLDDRAGGGLVLGITGDFAVIAGSRVPRATTPEEFAQYERADACKAVMTFRLETRRGGTVLSTDTRVQVGSAIRR